MISGKASLRIFLASSNLRNASLSLHEFGIECIASFSALAISSNANNLDLTKSTVFESLKAKPCSDRLEMKALTSSVSLTEPTSRKSLHNASISALRPSISITAVVNSTTGVVGVGSTEVCGTMSITSTSSSSGLSGSGICTTGIGVTTSGIGT